MHFALAVLEHLDDSRPIGETIVSVGILLVLLLALFLLGSRRRKK